VPNSSGYPRVRKPPLDAALKATTGNIITVALGRLRGPTHERRAASVLELPCTLPERPASSSTAPVANQATPFFSVIQTPSIVAPEIQESS